MRQAAYFVSAVLAACIAGHAHAAPAMSERDLADCDVLTGKAKKAAFNKELRAMKRASDAGAVEDVMRYGAVLHNKMACINEEVTGSSGWGIVQTDSDGSTQAIHPPHADPGTHPDMAATLREAIRSFERIADTDIPARVLLAGYYANYNQYLHEPGKGYLYIASVYAEDCMKPGQPARSGNGRCQALRQDRILYNSLLTPAQRARLDVQAASWAEQYRARNNR
jgi:hypothetical protein